MKELEYYTVKICLNNQIVSYIETNKYNDALMCYELNYKSMCLCSYFYAKGKFNIYLIKNNTIKAQILKQQEFNL